MIDFQTGIDHRILLLFRSPIFRSKSDPEIHFQIDPRLKISPGTTTQTEHTIGPRFFSGKPVSDLRIRIGSRNFFSDRSAIFFCKSIRDFATKIGSRFFSDAHSSSIQSKLDRSRSIFQSRSRSRLKIKNQTLQEIFQSNLAEKFSIRV